jgi:hypothetical protein
LHACGIESIRALVADKDWNVLVKLHPCSLRVDEPKFSGGHDWTRELAGIAAEAGNLRHIVDEDITKLMCASDVIIGDFSSTSIDYACSGKPTLFFRSETQRNSRSGYDKQWRLLEQASAAFSDIQEFIVQWNAVKAGEWEGADGPAVDNLRTEYHPHLGHATERSLRVLYEVMDLPLNEVQRMVQASKSYFFGHTDSATHSEEKP